MCLVTDGGCLWYERETERRKMERERKGPNEWKCGKRQKSTRQSKQKHRQDYIDTNRRKDGRQAAVYYVCERDRSNNITLE